MTYTINDIDYITILSHRHKLGRQVQKTLVPLKTKLFDGTGYPSFSKAVNDCIVACPTELVIIASEKARPSPADFQKLLDLLNKGFGLVCLWGLGFFGFDKELIRRVGFLDEQFIPGGYEDIDFQRRLREANIAEYWKFEIPFKRMISTWDQTDSKKIHDKKWQETSKDIFKRKLPEETYPYDLGPSNPEISFLPFCNSEFGRQNPNSPVQLQFTKGTKGET